LSPKEPIAQAPERVTPRISVVIVSFNRIDQLRENLHALGIAPGAAAAGGQGTAAAGRSDHQIVVVDNGSSSGIADLNADFQVVRWSRLPKNFGLTKALNIGIRASEGEYILLLHDDVRITGETVSKLADYLETHPDAGAVCPLLTDASGNPVAQLRDLPGPSNSDPALRIPPDGEETSVECVSGAAIMFRSFYLRGLRQIDERYGNYGSAIELCQQVRRSARKLVILHSVTAIHENSASPMPKSALAGDRASGTAAFLGKHHGFASGLIFRIKTALAALLTLRFSVLAGAISGQKIDGTG
jgi:GT2 family glycosyltransferase